MVVYCRECDEEKGDSLYCPYCGERDGDVQRFGITIGQRPETPCARLHRLDVPTRQMEIDEDPELDFWEDDYE